MHARVCFGVCICVHDDLWCVLASVLGCVCVCWSVCVRVCACIGVYVCVCAWCLGVCVCCNVFVYCVCVRNDLLEFFNEYRTCI